MNTFPNSIDNVDYFFFRKEDAYHGFDVLRNDEGIPANLNYDSMIIHKENAAVTVL